MRLPTVIAPSILSADFAHLGQEVEAIVEGGADYIHFDVMDNHYVPNLTFGPMICEALKPYAKNQLLDVHLMVDPVDDLAHMFAQAGADIITFHPEATRHVDRSLQAIRDAGCQAGLVLNPATPLDYIDYVMDKLDVVMMMSVNPGFGGQSFIPATISKMRALRAKLDAHAAQTGQFIRLEVDGGIKVDNIAEVAAAGADTFVSGSGVFGTDNYAQTIQAMRAAVASVSEQ